jgi:uncharacterized protein
VSIVLTDIEARVLGCLVEKEITTPEYYPLSLNALVHACNQKSNRHPVMNLEEDSVRRALRGLEDHALARSASGDSRVAKFEHRLADSFNFTRPETAILCELLLRGAQTPGELRSRAERLHPFEDLSVVHSTLKHLMEREPPLVKVLPRQPGTKEARYAHLLCGDVQAPAPEATPETESSSVHSDTANDERMVRLESEVARLHEEIQEVQRQFAEFRKQFE